MDKICLNIALSITKMSSVSFGSIVTDMDEPAFVEKVLKSLERASWVEFGNSSFLKLVLFSKEADISTSKKYR